MTFALEFATCTDTGLCRSNNEDCVRVDQPLALAVLADGMGGYQAGEVASEMACRVLTDSWRDWIADPGAPRLAADMAHGLTLAAQAANAQVYAAANSKPEWSGMGTTLVVGHVHGDELWLGHIGDSRAYHLRGGELHPLTKDHSLLQEQLDAGLITEEDAATAVHRNLVTRAVGVESDVALEVHRHAIHAEDIVLMCSDGLSDMLTPEQMTEILLKPLPLTECAQALVAAANAAGGRDNIAVILVKAQAAPASADGARNWWPPHRQ